MEIITAKTAEPIEMPFGCDYPAPDPAKERAVLRVGKYGHALSVYIGAWIFGGDNAAFYIITLSLVSIKAIECSVLDN